MSWQAHGFRAWFLQRVSAIYILVCLLVVMGVLFYNPVVSYAGWRALFTNLFTNILVLLFFIAIMVHAWIGVRDVVIDYVHHTIARLIVLNLVMALLISLSVWITYILFTLVKL